MIYTSIFEKLLLILNIISTSWAYIAFILVAIALIILLALKKISKRTCFLLMTIATTLVLGYTVYAYYEPISKMTNSIVDNLFLNIYFPSAYAYLFILVLINIVTITSLLNPHSEKIYKTVNGTCFIITNFTLALILEVIAKDNVDIFTKESLFTNPNLITLLEFGINIFIIWLISLVAIYLINIITERIMVSRENKILNSAPAVTINTKIAIDEPTLQEEYQETTTETPAATLNPVQAFIPESQNKFIPNFTITTNEIVEEPQNKFIPNLEINTIKETTPAVEQPLITSNNNYSYDNNSFDLSSFIPKKQEVKPISISTNNTTSQIFEQILTNELPVIKEESQPTPTPSIEDTKNTYTLNDYRIFNKMLKDIREHNQSNSVTIDKNLEYRLITKYSTETYNMFKTMLKIYSN